MENRLSFWLNRARERLWFKPLMMCIISVAAVFLAKIADDVGVEAFVFDINKESVHALLDVMAKSMLTIATFAAGSMVAAYASASNTATPRSLPLVIADDVSQNALSTFVGAFIFSLIGLTALENDYYEQVGLFALFCLTLLVFTLVIITFIRWVDSIARLGRLENCVDKAESATRAAMQRRRRLPNLGGVPLSSNLDHAKTLYGDRVGYIQRIHTYALQQCAEQADIRIVVAALPGTFTAPDRPLVHLVPTQDRLPADVDTQAILNAFLIGDSRKFDEDPRFGLVVMSEIAIRALSPAVNDPGSAIDIIGRFVRLFALMAEPIDNDERASAHYDRVEVPKIAVDDMFDDAFNPIARDGAGFVEVMIRLQKALAALAKIDDGSMAKAAREQALRALTYAEESMKLNQDLVIVQKLTRFAKEH